MRTENGSTGRSGSSFIEAARRAQIIEAATATVAEVGYARASLARIAQQAGISKSVISYHFDGKDELLEQLVAQFFDDAWAYMAERLDAAETAADKLRTWVSSQLAYFGSHRTGFLAMAEIVTNHRRPDGSRPFADAEAEEIAELTRLLVEGQRDGELRDFDAATVAVIISQTIEGALGAWAMDDAVDLDTHAAALADFIHHAIRHGEPSP